MLKIDEKDKPMWLWVFDIIKAMDSGCGILVGHHVHFDGPVANSTEYIIKSEYDKLKAENRMLKSSDHVRETFKAKEINELEAEVEKYRVIVLKLLPAAIWFFEGPYGPSPDPEALKEARALLWG